MWAEPEKYKVIGKVLAAARERAQLTQQELARKIRKPQSFVSNVEQGQRRIDIVEFLKLAEGLGADPRKVFLELLASLTSRRR